MHTQQQPQPVPADPGCNPPTFIGAQDAGGKRQPIGVGQVGEGRVSSADDLRRELSIQQRGRDAARHQRDLEAINARDPHVFSDFVDAAMERTKRDQASAAMHTLIAQRSPEQIARMQAWQEERMAREPGATHK